MSTRSLLRPAGLVAAAGGAGRRARAEPGAAETGRRRERARAARRHRSPPRCSPSCRWTRGSTVPTAPRPTPSRCANGSFGCIDVTIADMTRRFNRLAPSLQPRRDLLAALPAGDRALQGRSRRRPATSVDAAHGQLRGRGLQRPLRRRRTTTGTPTGRPRCRRSGGWPSPPRTPGRSPAPATRCSAWSRTSCATCPSRSTTIGLVDHRDHLAINTMLRAGLHAGHRRAGPPLRPDHGRPRPSCPAPTSLVMERGRAVAGEGAGGTRRRWSPRRTRPPGRPVADRIEREAWATGARPLPRQPLPGPAGDRRPRRVLRRPTGTPRTMSLPWQACSSRAGRTVRRSWSTSRSLVDAVHGRRGRRAGAGHRRGRDRQVPAGPGGGGAAPRTAACRC